MGDHSDFIHFTLVDNFFHSGQKIASKCLSRVKLSQFSRFKYDLDIKVDLLNETITAM